jgi:RHS repeat-associated protein
LDGDTGRTVHYIFEPGSFVPVAQALRHKAIDLPRQPEYSGDYSFEEDPLWNQVVTAQPFDVLAWYQCDHLGTPLELTDQHGDIAWSAQYKAWGEVREQRSASALQQGLTNPIRFQGQYHDYETGLYYNRHRYYDPETGRFVSKDPIGFAGGINLYQFAPNPIQWIDPLGLAKKPPSKLALKDGDGASPQDIAASKAGGGDRKGQSSCRKKLVKKSKPVGVYKCWRCGHTSTNPDDMHLGHKNVPTSKGGNLADVNVDLEGASCNLSAGNSGYVKEGMSCVERGSCGAPYGR